ncbi:type VI secretion system protein VasJ [Stigmatella aurantiaca]|uniref:Type VI secretion system protein VasJ n=1 Tax=Stigmatella aurantiaca TaxID=41 RepID=A0A1H7NY04_STIAU|nr:type VI secretion system protein TssA [Stigmatella aurantiaca]SEL28266.1 type VI secretion system protein VasJ [Stigmatella aurantiaca]
MTASSTGPFLDRALAWLEPISTEAPCGAPSKHHPTYEAVSAEIAKLESPTGDTVRWEEVVRGAGELLRDTSKDLWLASYFAYGLYATEGIPGAITGTTLLTELTERYWQGLFPEASRLRSRSLALTWFVERMGWVLPNVQPHGTSPEQIEALAAAVSKLAEVTRARLAAQAPALGPLLTGIERLRANFPNEAPRPAAAPQSPPPVLAPPLPPPASSPAVETPATPSAPLSAPPPAPPPVLASQLPMLPSGEPTSVGAVTDFLRNMGASLTSTAVLLRQANPADPLAYRILRTGLWLHISQLPPAQSHGRTALPPLPAALRSKLEILTANARWLELLDEAESATVQHRFALELQRFSVHALTSLGPTHAPAREALLLELSSLLKRLPGVVDLVASDGTPLADAATQEWLHREVLAKPTPAPKPRKVPPLPREAKVPPQEALPAQDSETLEELQSHANTASTGRARFVTRLRLARLCAQEGHTSAARALYEALDAECTASALDAWEPALAAACLEGFLACTTAGKDLPNELVGDFWIRYRRLAQLDTAAALRVHP